MQKFMSRSLACFEGIRIDFCHKNAKNSASLQLLLVPITFESVSLGILKF